MMRRCCGGRGLMCGVAMLCLLLMKKPIYIEGAASKTSAKSLRHRNIRDRRKRQRAALELRDYNLFGTTTAYQASPPGPLEDLLPPETRSGPDKETAYSKSSKGLPAAIPPLTPGDKAKTSTPTPPLMLPIIPVASSPPNTVSAPGTSAAPGSTPIPGSTLVPGATPNATTPPVGTTAAPGATLAPNATVPGATPVPNATTPPGSTTAVPGSTPVPNATAPPTVPGATPVPVTTTPPGSTTAVPGTTPAPNATAPPTVPGATPVPVTTTPPVTTAAPNATANATTATPASPVPAVTFAPSTMYPPATPTPPTVTIPTVSTPPTTAGTTTVAPTPSVSSLPPGPKSKKGSKSMPTISYPPTSYPPISYSPTFTTAPTSSKSLKGKSSSSKSKGKGKGSSKGLSPKKSVKNEPKKKLPKVSSKASPSYKHSSKMGVMSKLSKQPITNAPSFPPTLPSSNSSTIVPSIPSTPTTNVPATSPPQTTPMPTAASSIMGQTLQLAPYSLGYAIEFLWIPKLTEVDQVAGVTQVYLDSFFKTIYTSLQTMTTARGDVKFFLDAPYQVNYTSTALFAPGLPVPNASDLDASLLRAFSGANLQTYITLLKDLGPDNIFSTTSNVTVNDWPIETAPYSQQASPQTTSPLVMSAVVVGAACGLIVLAGVVYNRKQQIRQHVKQFKRRVVLGDCSAVKKIKKRGRKKRGGSRKGTGRSDDGPKTVAGDTEAESTTSPAYDDETTIFGALTTATTQQLSYANESAILGVSQYDATYSLAGGASTSSSIGQLRGPSHLVCGENRDITRGINECDDDDDEDEDGEYDEEYDEETIEDDEQDASLRHREATSQPRNAEITRSESEDEDVPMRVVDLIRFFTPPRRLEPPGKR